MAEDLSIVTKQTPPKAASRAAAASSWLARSVARLFGRHEVPTADASVKKKKRRTRSPRKKGPTRKPDAARPDAPIALTKEQTRELPPFDALPLARIHVPKTAAECKAAAEEILAAGVAGFDTESKPNFKAGEKSTGPHVVQFALADKAFILQTQREECRQIAADLIASDRVLKVGFGLRNDHGQIRNRFGVQLENVIDLDHVFRKRGYKGQIGVRAAVGALFERSFPKSKSTTTSNWAAPELSPKQLLYAANDAYAALKIKEALDLKESLRPRRS